MLNPASPLYIKPRLDPTFIGWMWRFYRSCSPRQFEVGVASFGALAAPTLRLFDQLAAEGLEFEMHESGLLYLGLEQRNIERMWDSLRLLEEPLGYTLELFSRAEVLERDPAINANVAGGIFMSKERHIRPDQLNAALVERIVELGGEVHSGIAVTGLRRHGTRIDGVETDDGEILADRVLLAAGAWSGRLATEWGYRLPLEAGKGYSITIENPDLNVQQPIDLIEGRAAMTPFDGAFRAAGTMELSGLNTNLAKTRVNAIRKTVERYLERWPEGEKPRAWVGMRPLTSDGLPMIGAMPRSENFYVATGHQMLGVTLAPSTAMVLTELMLDGESSIDLTPFDPGRFAGRQRSRVAA
jgi:D-amino-acid dehydrogenase